MNHGDEYGRMSYEILQQISINNLGWSFYRNISK